MDLDMNGLSYGIPASLPAERMEEASAGPNPAHPVPGQDALLSTTWIAARNYTSCAFNGAHLCCIHHAVPAPDVV